MKLSTFVAFATACVLCQSCMAVGIHAPAERVIGAWPVGVQELVPREVARAGYKTVNDARAPLTEYEKTNPLHILDDGCASVNLYSCSGHGTCTDRPTALFGIVPENTRQTHAFCLCTAGHFGLGCSMTLDTLSDSDKEKLAAAGFLKKTDKHKYVVTSKYPTTTHDSFFSGRNKFKGKLKSLPDNVRKPAPNPAAYYPDADEPENTSLELFVDPPAKLVAEGSQMVAKLLDAQRRLGTEEQRIAKLHKATPKAVNKNLVALYTSWKGRTIEGPVIAPGQKAYEPGKVGVEPNKFLDTLNKAVTPDTI